MAKFDVYRDKHSENLLLDCQADLLDHLRSRLMIPLLPEAQAPVPAARLNPTFTIGTARFVMMTEWASAVQLRQLDEPVNSLLDEQDAIGNALDMLIVGF